MTSNEQIRLIAQAIPDGMEAVNFYFNRYDVPMRVTVRNKATGEIALYELDLSNESLLRVH